MIIQNQNQAEQVGQSFDDSKFLEVQKKTIAALHLIAKKIHIGMLEEEAYELAKAILAELGFGKSWHRPYVRFGENTCLMYGQASKPEVRLKDTDLFYLDIGPVMDGYEGDAGDTFCVGQESDLKSEMERCISDSRLLFQDIQDQWSRNHLTGVQLYEYGSAQAQKKGWILNREWDGHRIGDFPHQVYCKGPLDEVEFVPASGLWVLEIHLCDPQKRFGAFYEDVMRRT